MFQWIRFLVSIHWCALIWSGFAFRDCFYILLVYNVPMPVLAQQNMAPILCLFLEFDLHMKVLWFWWIHHNLYEFI